LKWKEKEKKQKQEKEQAQEQTEEKNIIKKQKDREVRSFSVFKTLNKKTKCSMNRLVFLKK